MRVHGTLVKWNDERGFGFIQPTVGTEQLFVHISAFPHDGIRPRIDEMISFEVELREDGTKRAVRLMRPAGLVRSPNRPVHRRPRSRRQRPMAGAIGWIGLLLCAIGYVSYSRIAMQHAANLAETVRSVPVELSPARPDRSATLTRVISIHPAQVLRARPAQVEQPVSLSRCDGRQYCAQMTSCAEATYFLQRCPGTHMDGDHDGIACEHQWCPGS